MRCQLFILEESYVEKASFVSFACGACVRLNCQRVRQPDANHNTAARSNQYNRRDNRSGDCNHRRGHNRRDNRSNDCRNGGSHHRRDDGSHDNGGDNGSDYPRRSDERCDLRRSNNGPNDAWRNDSGNNGSNRRRDLRRCHGSLTDNSLSGDRRGDNGGNYCSHDARRSNNGRHVRRRHDGSDDGCGGAAGNAARHQACDAAAVRNERRITGRQRRQLSTL